MPAGISGLRLIAAAIKGARILEALLTQASALRLAIEFGCVTLRDALPVGAYIAFPTAGRDRAIHGAIPPAVHVVSLRD